MLPADTTFEDITAEIISGDFDSGSVKILPGPEEEIHSGVVLFEVDKSIRSGHSHWEVRVVRNEDGIGAMVTFKANVIDDLRASPAFIIMKARTQSTHENVIRLLRRSEESYASIQSFSMSENLEYWATPKKVGDMVVITFTPEPDSNRNTSLPFGQRIRGSISLKSQELEQAINIPVEIWP